jgi:hypothetical protein
MMRSNPALRFALFLILASSLACSTPSISGTKQSYGPCDNVLYPFFFGAHWVYQIDKQDGSAITKFGLTVVKVADSQATIDSLDMSTGITTQITADCDNGAIRNFPIISQNMLIGNTVASDFDMEYVGGLFAPAQSAFIDNDWLYNWTAEYIVSGTIQAQVEGETLSIVLQDTPLHMTWQTAGSGDAAFEPITVPAGSFERALKIENVISMDISLTLAGLPVNGKLTLRSTQWFEPFTGLLKAQIDSGEVSALGVNIPVAVKGTVELVEYLTAH